MLFKQLDHAVEFRAASYHHERPRGNELSLRPAYVICSITLTTISSARATMRFDTSCILTPFMLRVDAVSRAMALPTEILISSRLVLKEVEGSDIVGDMPAAKRQRGEIDQMSLLVDGDGGCLCSHVDEHAAEPLLLGSKYHLGGG